MPLEAPPRTRARPPAPSLLLAAAALLAAPLGAQERRADAAVCEGRRITAVDVAPAPPPALGEGVPGWVRPIVRVALQHRTTRPAAVIPFLFTREGDECDPHDLDESERALRAQPYLADAEVRAVDDGAGGVRIEVVTVDEIPLVAGVGVRGGDLSKLKYGSANVFGQGVHAHAQWTRGFAYRDGFGARVVHHHVLGRAIRLTAAGERARVGGNAALVVERPFYSDFQKVAWHVGGREMREYVGFVRPDEPALSLPYERTLAEAGGILRIGSRSIVLFAGPLLSYERSRPADEAVVVSDTGLASDDDPTLDGRYDSFERHALGGVAGIRLLRFLEVRGFDALLGPQDAGVGMQVATALARVAGSGDEGWAAGADLYAGAGTTRSFVVLRTQWEGRRETSGWGDVVGSGRLAWYSRPSSGQTMILGAELAGAWRARRPFQLSLGNARGGVRGYDDTRDVGARRLVVRAERRWLAGGISDWLALGVAGFADAGKVWAGDVPYGVTTGVRTSVGGGLLAAAPRQSRRLVRVDVAVPLASDPHAASYSLRLTTSSPIATFWREPGDIGRVRAVMPSAGLVAWP
ncbi:MAG TPA: hypothetical protein VFZ11_11180 [Gemmatimonadaceae bacterium]